MVAYAGPIVVLTFGLIIILVTLGLDIRCTRSRQWMCLSTNARVFIIQVGFVSTLLSLGSSGQTFPSIDSALELFTPSSMLWIVTPTYLLIGFVVNTITMLFRIKRLRPYKYFPIDESSRLGIYTFASVFAVTILFESGFVGTNIINYMKSLAVFQIIAVEIFTFVNPFAVWRLRDSIKVARPKCLLVGAVLGRVCSISLFLYGIFHNPTGPFDMFVLGILLSTVFQLYINNQFTNYFSALSTASVKNKNILVVEGLSEPLMMTLEEIQQANNSSIDEEGAFSRFKWLTHEDPNSIGLAGIESMGVFQLSTIFATLIIASLSIWPPAEVCNFLGGVFTNNTCVTEGIFLSMQSGFDSDSNWFFCVLLVVRLGFQQAAFTEIGTHRMVASSPYKHAHGIARLVEFLSSWKGQHVLAALNFGGNALFFGIACGVNAYPSAFPMPQLALTISILGTCISFHTFAVRRSKWTGCSKILPSDDSLRLTILIKGAMLTIKTLIIVKTGTNVGFEWDSVTGTFEISLLFLFCISLFVLGTCTVVNVVKMWPRSRELATPNPRTLLVAYVVLFIWIQCASLFSVISSKMSVEWICGSTAKQLQPDQSKTPFPLPECILQEVFSYFFTPAVFGIVYMCNELSRLLQKISSKETIGVADSHMAVVSLNPVLAGIMILTFTVACAFKCDAPAWSFLVFVLSIPTVFTMVLQAAITPVGKPDIIVQPPQSQDTINGSSHTDPFMAL